MITVWNILGIITILCLIVFYSGKNAVWLTFTIGFIAALMIGAALMLIGKGFNAPLVKKITIVATLIGVAIELVGKLLRPRDYEHVNNK
jgi:hypothetical protein